jgi:uncharacterized oligopeptide transporter (OPT) family protein
MSASVPHKLSPSRNPEAIGFAESELHPPLDARQSGAFPAEATLRAFLTGMVLAAGFSAVNLYLGLKVGLGINLSIPSALLAYFGALLLGGRRGRFTILETNLAQTGASAGAAVAATGLVTAVPALTLATGYDWSWAKLAVWIVAIGLLGVAAAIMVRRQLIEVERLPFAVGTATAGLLQELYEREKAAVGRLVAMVSSALAAGVIYLFTLPMVRSFQFTSVKLPGTLAGRPAADFGWSLAPSTMLYALGPLIGIRASASMLLGALAGYAIWGPQLVAHGTVEMKEIFRWMSWPAIAALVGGALCGLFVALARPLFRTRKPPAPGDAPTAGRGPRGVDRSALPLAIGSVALVTVLQVYWFGIGWGVAFGASIAAFVFAAVAGRITGEVAMTPSGPLAKAAQLTFGLQSASPAANLIPANVAGGAASQCCELIHDLKCGRILGASWRWQSVAQMLGVMAGAAAGAVVYINWIAADISQLGTPEVPAPAAKLLLGMSEVLTKGQAALPVGAAEAMVIVAAMAGAFAIVEQVVPATVRRWMPAPVAVGFGLLIGPGMALPIFLSAAVAAILLACRPALERAVIVVCIGAVLGESLTALAIALFPK